MLNILELFYVNYTAIKIFKEHLQRLFKGWSIYESRAWINICTPTFIAVLQDRQRVETIQVSMDQKNV